MPSSRIALHICVLIFVLTAAFLVSLTPIKNYYLEISAVLVLGYIGVRRIVSSSAISPDLRGLIYASIFAFIAMYTVLSSGGLQSPYFFLLFFLIFALSILLDPIVSLVVSIAIMFLFTWHLSTTFKLEDVVPLISLPFLVPFAIFLGKEHQELMTVQKAQEKDTSNMFLFLSIVIKGHLDAVHDLVMNFRGDHDLSAMSRILKRTKRLIDQFEEEIKRDH